MSLITSCVAFELRWFSAQDRRLRVWRTKFGCRYKSPQYIWWQRFSAIDLQLFRTLAICATRLWFIFKIYPLSVISLTCTNISALRHPRPADAERARSIFVATACLHPDGGVEAKGEGRKRPLKFWTRAARLSKRSVDFHPGRNCRKVSPLYDDLHDRDEGGDLYPWYWKPSFSSNEALQIPIYSRDLERPVNIR